MVPWQVLSESEREQWVCEPLTAVGPLRFGMTPEQASAALDGWTMRVAPARRGFEGDRRAEFVRPGDRPYRVAVSAYFGPAEGLVCVVADALCGPQVSIGGVRLVGRAPSELEAELIPTLGFVARCSPEGNVTIEELGLTMRVQRAGDFVLTRPVCAVVREMAYTLWDGMPHEELSFRSA
jgi:hypothetical protein